MSDHVLIVGASLAGLRAAEAVRDAGFAGRLTLVGEEPCAPYDRPPLSKQVLSGWVNATQTELPALRPVDAEWILGVRATGLDRGTRAVQLSDGSWIGFDRLLVATGARARRWPVAAEARLDGVISLRTRDDARVLRTRLASRPERVVVVGGGFTGCEVASSCIDLGVPVTVVEALEAPLQAALGATVGRYSAAAQRAKGVDLRTGVSVTSLEADGAGRLARVRLSDGQAMETSVAVICLGAMPNIEWLGGSGLAVSPRGLHCDSAGRALGADGCTATGIFAAGDVVQMDHPAFPGPPLRTEHWASACEQAAVAGANIAQDGEPTHRIAALPGFWSMQFGACLKLVGAPERADRTELLHGSVESGRFVVGYGQGGRLVAAAAVDHTHWLPFYETQIEAGAAFPPTFARVDPPIAPTAVAAQELAS